MLDEGTNFVEDTVEVVTKKAVVDINNPPIGFMTDNSIENYVDFDDKLLNDKDKDSITLEECLDFMFTDNDFDYFDQPEDDGAQSVASSAIASSFEPVNFKTSVEFQTKLSAPPIPQPINEILQKFNNPEGLLGTKILFSFQISNFKSYALELVLTAMASNSFYLKRLFAIVKGNDKFSLEYQLVIILIQILAGGKNISIENLINHMIIYAPKTQILDSDPYTLEAKLSRCLAFFC